MLVNIGGMNNYHGRLKSFTKSWPFSSGSLSPHEMAKAGFYFLKGDSVKCYYCEKELEGWCEGENVYEEHKNHAPFCPFVKMFPDPPNVVTLHQAIDLERDKLLLISDRQFKAWEVEFRSKFNKQIAKLAKEFEKNRKVF